VSCRELFKKFNILPLVSELFLSLQSFTVDNVEKSQTNFDIQSINTRHKHNVHMPNANLTNYEKGAYYAGIKLFNIVSSNIKSLS
jgi:hypothetical protein